MPKKNKKSHLGEDFVSAVRAGVDSMCGAAGMKGFTQDKNVDPCGDGRQTPLNSNNNQAQKNAWAEGLDFDIHRLDKFDKGCLCGDLGSTLRTLVIPTGHEVKISGIASKKELNGQLGKVREYASTSNRYTIVFHEAGETKILAIKPSNLLVLGENSDEKSNGKSNGKSDEKSNQKSDEKSEDPAASVRESKTGDADGDGGGTCVGSSKYVPWLHCRRSNGGPTTYQLMEKRQSQMRFTALHCAVRGSKVISGPPGVQLKHAEVISALLAHGANVASRDVAGYTPLHHALSSPNNALSRSLGVLLMDNGADINAQTRFGAPAIHESIMSVDKNTFTLLMDRHARIDLNDNDGCNPANNSLICQPWFSKKIIKRNTAQQKERMAANPVGDSKCANPGCDNLGTKKCVRCVRARYCCRDCQVSHWKGGHKAECGGTAGTASAEKECVISLENPGNSYISTLSLNSQRAYQGNTQSMSKKARKHHPDQKRFKVKVQVPMDGSFGMMMVYDEKRSFSVQLMPNVRNAKQVHGLVRKYGPMGGLKGFMYAYVKDENLHLILQDPLPKACSW